MNDKAVLSKLNINNISSGNSWRFRSDSDEWEIQDQKGQTSRLSDHFSDHFHRSLSNESSGSNSNGGAGGVIEGSIGSVFSNELGHTPHLQHSGGNTSGSGSSSMWPGIGNLLCPKIEEFDRFLLPTWN